MLAVVFIVLIGVGATIGMHVLQSRIERWDYDRHFED